MLPCGFLCLFPLFLLLTLALTKRFQSNCSRFMGPFSHRDKRSSGKNGDVKGGVHRPESGFMVKYETLAFANREASRRRKSAESRIS